MEILLEQGEYDHHAYHPVKDFISSVLDVTIVKPIAECFLGKDLITGERLSDLEKGLKLTGAIINLFALGQSCLVYKAAGIAGKELAREIGKTILVDMLTDTAVYGAGSIGEQMELPAGAIWMLSMATGCVVSAVGTKLLLKDIHTGVLRESSVSELAEDLQKSGGKQGFSLIGKDIASEDIEACLRVRKGESLSGFTEESREAIRKLEELNLPDEELESILKVRNRKPQRNVPLKPENEIPTIEDEVIKDGGDSIKSGSSSGKVWDYAKQFDGELSNFNDGYEIKNVIDEDLCLVQFHSNAEVGNGRSLKYWTTFDEANGISTVDDYMNKMALLSNWGARDNVSIAKIPAGTKIKYAIGTAKEQVGAIESRPGGGLQILFEQFDDGWVLDTRPLP